MNPELLEILCCPETHQRLELAGSDLVDRLNEMAVAGKLRNRAGKLVSGRLDGVLLRADGKVAYPIRNGIPVLLIDDGIVLGD